MNLVKTALTYVVIFSAGALTSVSCFEAEFGNPSFRCSPATSAACPDSEVCCSDDPATTKGRLPNYHNGLNNATFGIPIFSGANNPLSSSGMCVATGFDTPLKATGCPVPCNPTWDLADREAICGPGLVCCQMQELDSEKDCIMDPTTGLFRPVSGADITLNLTDWGPKHTTNQDPNGEGCMVFAAGGGATIDAAARNDCYAQLTVANQRGFCYKSCPCIDDVCDMKNPGFVSKCGGTAAPTTTM